MTTKLRKGWTTGTCATAATKAACLLLRDGTAPAVVGVPLPKGDQRPSFPVEDCFVQNDGRAHAVVVKDAGDDPDVTHGARMTARVRVVDAPPGLVLRGGEGVGTVTREGLGLEVGAPAINAGPRAQLRAAVGEVFDVARVGVDVELSVPGGVEMAAKTSNGRLGILGGISILGTTGIVRPFSTAAWRASVGQAIDVMHAQGEQTVVLVTGARSEAAARRLHPGLPEVCFIEVGDFIGYALKRARTLRMARVVLVGMVGKLSKVANGTLMTHSAGSKVDLEVLAELTRAAGGDDGLVGSVRKATTARHAWEQWQAAGLTRASELICERAATVMREYVADALDVEVVLVDFAGERVA